MGYIYNMIKISVLRLTHSWSRLRSLHLLLPADFCTAPATVRCSCRMAATEEAATTAPDPYLLSKDTVSSFFLQFTNPKDNLKFIQFCVQRSQSLYVRIQLGIVSLLATANLIFLGLESSPSLYFFLYLLGIFSMLPLVLLPGGNQFQRTRQILRWSVYMNSTIIHLSIAFHSIVWTCTKGSDPFSSTGCFFVFPGTDIEMLQLYVFGLYSIILCGFEIKQCVIFHFIATGALFVYLVLQAKGQLAVSYSVVTSIVMLLVWERERLLRHAWAHSEKIQPMVRGKKLYFIFYKFSLTFSLFIDLFRRTTTTVGGKSTQRSS